MILADTRAAADHAIAEAFKRERMAPDDYKPVPDAPVPMEDSNGTPRDTEKRPA